MECNYVNGSKKKKTADLIVVDKRTKKWRIVQVTWHVVGMIEVCEVRLGTNLNETSLIGKNRLDFLRLLQSLYSYKFLKMETKIVYSFPISFGYIFKLVR